MNFPEGYLKIKSIGNAADLQTDAKKLVDAINEVNESLGDTEILETSEKGSIVGAINELKSADDTWKIRDSAQFKNEAQKIIRGHCKEVSGYGSIDVPNNAKGQIGVVVNGVTETDENGTKSAFGSVRIKSMGKNLWGEKSDTILVQPNTDYTFSCYDAPNIGALIEEFDAAGVNIYREIVDSGSHMTTKNKTRKIRYSTIQSLYTDPDIYGVEVDFANRTFTRLAGAVGKTPGADFDSILAFGGRKRCNLADDGTVNAYFGDAGYIEDGSNGQVMVEQPKFYYKVVPLKMEKNDEVEIVSVKFDTGAAVSGNITINLNGTIYNIAVAAGDDTTAVATKVRNASYAGWTTGGSGTTVTFTAIKPGTRLATTFTDTGSTGVTATITRTQPGYIGKGYKLRKARYYVSMTKKAGFKVHPAFVQNGVEREFIYLSAYEGSLYDVSASAYILDDAQIADFTASTGDKLSSISNAKPISGLTQDLTRRKCGILAENRGNGWYQQYAATIACSQLLFTIEYASMNTQSKIGAGVTNKALGEGNESELTGATTNLGNASGSVTNTNGYNVVSYRGEENLWGNIWKFTDGMNIYCDASQGIHSLYIADNAFAESKNTDNYKDAGITLATKEGYVSAMAYNEDFDWLFVPAETLGDSALPVGDYFYQNVSSSTGYRVAPLGGYWYNGSTAGAFYWYVHTAPSARARYIGGRLVYVPPVV
jgi:predicted heme/steroid binding protein